jgi:hypothetical protein
VELDQRDVVARRGGALAVDPPGGAQDQEAGGVDLGSALRDPGTDDLSLCASVRPSALSLRAAARSIMSSSAR